MLLLQNNSEMYFNAMLHGADYEKIQIKLESIFFRCFYFVSRGSYDMGAHKALFAGFYI